MSRAPYIFIDADACPVKDEVYKVASRYGLKTFVVANAFLQVPQSPMIERVVVEAGPDIADDWIADQAVEFDVVITNDIPLADRVLKKGASALAPNGPRVTPDSIGPAPPSSTASPTSPTPPPPRAARCRRSGNWRARWRAAKPRFHGAEPRLSRRRRPPRGGRGL